MSDSQSSDLRQALRDALPGAMTARNTPARDAIRSALAAIENAEAVTQNDQGPGTTSQQIAGAAVGVGSTEANRAELDDEHILELVTAEREERLTAAAEYRQAGAIDRAERLEAEAAALDAFLC